MSSCESISGKAVSLINNELICICEGKKFIFLSYLKVSTFVSTCQRNLSKKKNVLLDGRNIKCDIIVCGIQITESKRPTLQWIDEETQQKYLISTTDLVLPEVSKSIHFYKFFISGG